MKATSKNDIGRHILAAFESTECVHYFVSSVDVSSVAAGVPERSVSSCLEGHFVPQFLPKNSTSEFLCSEKTLLTVRAGLHIRLQEQSAGPAHNVLSEEVTDTLLSHTSLQWISDSSYKAGVSELFLYVAGDNTRLEIRSKHVFGLCYRPVRANSLVLLLWCIHYGIFISHVLFEWTFVTLRRLRHFESGG